MITGAITTVASGTKRPVTNASPHSNSVTFSKVRKYGAASNPSLKVFTAPVNSGFGTRLKRTTIDAKRNSSPISVRTMIIAIFIYVYPLSPFEV
jgi:hypothetical protein